MPFAHRARESHGAVLNSGQALTESIETIQHIQEVIGMSEEQLYHGREREHPDYEWERRGYRREGRIWERERPDYEWEPRSYGRERPYDWEREWPYNWMRLGQRRGH